MKTVALDVHADVTQLAIVTEHGEVLLEMQVRTRPEELRRIVAGIAGPKRVVFPRARRASVTSRAVRHTKSPPPEPGRSWSPTTTTVCASMRPRRFASSST